jgi:site-specific recombinase XerD
VVLFADSGLRCQELCHLQQADLTESELVIRNGKGGKRRSVSLGVAAAQVLHEYIGSYRPSGEPFLFLTDEGREMKPRHIAKRLEIWAEKAGVKNAIACTTRSGCCLAACAHAFCDRQ